MTDENTTIQELKNLMRDFVAEREWEKYHTPRSLAISISIEAAELLEIFQWNEGMEPTAEDIKTDDETYTRVKEEVADVFLYLVEICNILNIDLSSAVKDKMIKNRKKYPMELYKGRAKLG